MRDLTDSRDKRMTDPKTLQSVLEAMIDKDGIQAIARAIQTTCELKAERAGHSRENRELARRWQRCAITAEILADRSQGL
jgi:hypothetical protein